MGFARSRLAGKIRLKAVAKSCGFELVVKLRFEGLKLRFEIMGSSALRAVLQVGLVSLD